MKNLTLDQVVMMRQDAIKRKEQLNADLNAVLGEIGAYSAIISHLSMPEQTEQVMESEIPTESVK